MAVECIRAAGVLGSTSLQAQRRRCAAQHVRCALVRILPCFGVKRRTGVGAPSVSALARGPRCFLTPFPLYEHLTSRATLIPVAFPFLDLHDTEMARTPTVSSTEVLAGLVERVTLPQRRERVLRAALQGPGPA